MQPKNTAKRNIWIWLGVGLAGGIAVILPFVTDIDMMDGGGAMIMGGLMLAITGPIVASLYWSRAKIFDELREEKNLLAHWQYNQEEWKKFAKDEHKYRQESYWGLFAVITVISLIIGIIFWIADPENGFYVMLAMIGLIILIAIVAWLAARSYAHWDQNLHPEVRIGRNGLIIHDQLHVWQGWGAKLEGTEIKIGTQKIMEITYSTPNRYSRQYYTIRVLIPSGQEKKATEIQNKLNS